MCLPHAHNQPVCPHAWARRCSAPSFGAWLPHLEWFLMMKRRHEVLVPAAWRGCGCSLQEIFASGFGRLQPWESWRGSWYLCSSLPMCPQVMSHGGNHMVIQRAHPTPGQSHGVVDECSLWCCRYGAASTAGAPVATDSQPLPAEDVIRQCRWSWGYQSPEAAD